MVNFEDEILSMQELGYNFIPERVEVKIPHAPDVLRNGLKFFSPYPVWLKSYDEIASWLTDNQGRGLLCMGNCGLGKTLICGKIIPIVLHHYHNLITSCYNATGISKQLDEILTKKVVYLDDVGTEDIANVYGNRRIPFAEITDMAEKQGNLLIITTNLNTNQISEKYGERVLDRLKAITKLVVISGKSLRK
jgi:DNA replication protein DnaC